MVVAADFSGTEQMAVADWQHPTLAESRGLGKMPVRYVGNKQELSQTVKLRCAHMLRDLVEEHLGFFSFVPATKWKELGETSLSNVAPGKMEDVWTNPEMFDIERMRRFSARQGREASPADPPPKRMPSRMRPGLALTSSRASQGTA